MWSNRQNESYYQYRANCRIRRDDGSEEMKSYELDTDILNGSIYFWNRNYYYRKSQNMLYALAAQDNRIVKCKILKEELVLIPRFTYQTDKFKKRVTIDIRKILLIVEMIILLFLSMAKPSMATEKNIVPPDDGYVFMH